MRTEKISTASIRKVIRGMKRPAGLFTGLSWSRALAPDNIVFFKRTDTAALRSVLGVSSNYHHRFELLVVLENGGPARIDDRTFLLEAGECALIFPHQFHHYIDVSNGAIEWLFITFELGEMARIQALRNAPRVLDADGLQFVQDIVREYVAPADQRPDAVEISYRLSRLLLHLVASPLIAPERRDIHTSDDVRDVILEKINRYMRSHLAAGPSIADLADAIGYSVSHLRAVFRTRLGISLGRYIRESRLSEAAKLLQSSDLKISAVAARSGFESLFAFSRAFKKAYGTSPKTYSKLVRQGAFPPEAGKPEW